EPVARVIRDVVLPGVARRRVAAPAPRRPVQRRRLSVVAEVHAVDERADRVAVRSRVDRDGHRHRGRLEENGKEEGSELGQHGGGRDPTLIDGCSIAGDTAHTGCLVYGQVAKAVVSWMGANGVPMGLL